jgi:hypothetical protein
VTFRAVHESAGQRDVLAVAGPNQPTDRDVARLGVQVVVVRQDAHEDDRTGDRESHSENERGRPLPSERAYEQRPDNGGHDALRHRAGNGDAADSQEFLGVELKADTEHQQDDPDFGELLGKRRVGNEPRCVRSDQRAGQQIADDRRQPDSMCQIAEDQRDTEADRQRQNEIVAVHVSSLLY